MKGNVNKSLDTMNAFGSMFSEEDKAVKQATADYHAAVEAANGSPSKLKEAQATYSKALSDIATSTLMKDKKLALEIPFMLTKKIKKQIKENKAYYEHERVLHKIEYPFECVLCGTTQKKGEIFVASTSGAGDAVCIDCADEQAIIDNKFYKLVTL